VVVHARKEEVDNAYSSNQYKQKVNR